MKQYYNKRLHPLVYVIESKIDTRLANQLCAYQTMYNWHRLYFKLRSRLRSTLDNQLRDQLHIIIRRQLENK